MWDFTLFGRTLFSVSDRTYNNRWIYYCLLVVVLTITAVPFDLHKATADPLGSVTAFVAKSFAASASAAPHAAEPTDDRAYDVEPYRLVVVSNNHRFAWGKIRVRGVSGTAIAPIEQYCNSDGCHWHAEFNDSFELGLTFGPYLLTAYDSSGKPIAMFRLDRTGTSDVEVITLYIERMTLSTMLKIDSVETHFQPLGRETYIAELLG